MAYKVIYSVNYINMPISIYLLIIMVIIIIILFSSKKQIISNPKVKKSLIIPMLIFSSLGGLGGTFIHERNAYYLNIGNYELIEGDIENFSPASSNKKGFESFRVSGKEFLYSRGLTNGGLEDSLSEYIKNGSHVKVYYRDDTILRIEAKN